MALYTLKKIAYHIALCAIVWLLIDQFSREGRLYAGWAAGALGAMYLLAAWFSYLKSKGTDFLKLIRRKHPPDVPYYLRGPDKETKAKLNLNGLRHAFDDDLAESADERANVLALQTRQRLNALAWAVVGAALLCVSFF